MNRKGFTLIELLATLIVLGIVVGITFASINGVFSNAKGKTEDIFVGTLEDALEIYLDSDAKKLNFGSNSVCTIYKTTGSVPLYKNNGVLTFDNVINSSYSPLNVNDLVNPANDEVRCSSNARVEIYRDSDYVYYYKVNKDGFGCLKNGGYISNLPSECE